MKHKFVINAFDGEGEAPAGEAGQITTAEGEKEGVTAPETSTPERKPFEEVIKEYKDDYKKHFQKEWNARHRDYKANQDTIKQQNSLIERMALKYGIQDTSDLKAIEAAMQEDDDLIASRAMQNGLSIEQQRRMDDVELENRRYREEQERAKRQEQATRQYNQWLGEANNLKIVFPDFDLDTEIQNEEFRNALSKGLSVERAFYSVHGAEIVSGAMQYTAQAVRQATIDEMGSRVARPRENGVSRQAPAKVSMDVHNLSKAQRAEIAAKSMREKQHL